MGIFNKLIKYIKFDSMYISTIHILCLVDHKINGKMNIVKLMNYKWRKS